MKIKNLRLLLKNLIYSNSFACGEARLQPNGDFAILKYHTWKKFLHVLMPLTHWVEPSVYSEDEDEAAFLKCFHFPSRGWKEISFPWEFSDSHSSFPWDLNRKLASTSYEFAIRTCSLQLSVFLVLQHSVHAAMGKNGKDRKTDTYWW